MNYDHRRVIIIVGKASRNFWRNFSVVYAVCFNMGVHDVNAVRNFSFDYITIYIFAVLHLTLLRRFSKIRVLWLQCINTRVFRKENLRKDNYTGSGDGQLQQWSVTSGLPGQRSGRTTSRMMSLPITLYFIWSFTMNGVHGCNTYETWFF